jgi:3-methylfumaryl-CoA hydratase
LCRASIRATIVPMPDTDLQAWVGRTETLHDDITAAPLRAFSATLDRATTRLPPGARPCRRWPLWAQDHEGWLTMNASAEIEQ